MNLAEKAEQKEQEKIYEEGGYTALWKYKMDGLYDEELWMHVNMLL